MLKIITGVSALYKQNIISYSPKKLHIEVPYGTNTLHLDKEIYKVKVQMKETIEIGVIEIDGDLYYCPERLLIELKKFPLENTIHAEAIKNLEKLVDVDLVHKYYEKLKRKRRGLDKEYIEKFLEANQTVVEKQILESDDPKSILREYIMAKVSRQDIPGILDSVLIKGGSSVELYIPNNRATLDVDAVVANNKVQDVIQMLRNKNGQVYFEIMNYDEIDYSKQIIKLELIAKSQKRKTNEKIKGIVMPISLNCTFDEKELKEIIDDYSIARRPLRRIQNANALVFTKEMLLAEKYQSIIGKPEQTTRSKDLLDLHFLINAPGDYDLIKFKKWLFLKWSTNKRKPLDKIAAIAKIRENKNKELVKIEANFKAASEMYEEDVTFEECLDVYNGLTQQILESES